MHPNPGSVRRDWRGGTAARRDGVRVFKQFSWLEVGSGEEDGPFIVEIIYGRHYVKKT